MTLIVAYYDLRGLASPIRYLLEYVGEEYVDKKYPVGPPPEYDRSEWLADKESLGFDFPNVPYLVDGDVKLTQVSLIFFSVDL